MTHPEHSPYADVDESDPNYDAYLWARQERITSGWVDGKFHAEARLSNASAAALLYRADGAQKIQMSGTSPFSECFDLRLRSTVRLCGVSPWCVDGV